MHSSWLHPNASNQKSVAEILSDELFMNLSDGVPEKCFEKLRDLIGEDVVNKKAPRLN